MILQLFDMAGVSSLTSRLLNDSGFQSVTLFREKDDPYAISEYYSSRKIANNPILMMIQLIVILLQLKPRIIVIHYHQLIVPWIKLMCLLLRIKSQLIMQYHGSDYRLHGVKPYVRFSTARTIGVTWDVVPVGGNLLENPVDEELFYPDYTVDTSRRAFFRPAKPLDCSWLADWYAQVFGFQLTYLATHTPYRYMGMVLRLHGWFFDMKGLDALSKTACEALACGAIVVNELGFFTYPNDVSNEHKIERIVEYYEQQISLQAARHLTNDD